MLGWLVYEHGIEPHVTAVVQDETTTDFLNRSKREKLHLSNFGPLTTPELTSSGSSPLR